MSENAEKWIVTLKEEGHDTVLPMKSGRPEPQPMIVLYGEQVFHHVETGIGNDRAWHSTYAPHEPYSLDREEPAGRLYDHEEVTEIVDQTIANSISTFAGMAGVCGDCGAHDCNCLPGAPCCAKCTHPKVDVVAQALNKDAVDGLTSPPVDDLTVTDP